ncbi:TPA: AIPR family protein [Streptococcus suis]
MVVNNSLTLLDAVLRKKGINNGEDAAKFEEYIISEILKNYSLSEDEVKKGIVDGSDDGGIDGFYTFLNGNLIQETGQRFVKSHAKIEVHIFTSKYESTFQLHPLESIDSSISELFDLSLEASELTSKFNAKVLKQREIFNYIFRELVADCSLYVTFHYFSRGDTKQISDSAHNIKRKSDKLKNQTETLLPTIKKCEFLFWGSDELLRLCTTRVNDTSSLKVKYSFQDDVHFVATVHIKEFYKFISDENGNLKQYYFDRNVRGFLGNNETNKDIQGSLNEGVSSNLDFWLLNNGITIIVSGAQKVTSDEIILKDVQIVNGLQTSYNIHSYVSETGMENITKDSRSVLVKIIKTNSDSDKARITKSTNNQTSISSYSLAHSNDTVQKDIEEILKLYLIRYNRKSNQVLESDEDVITPLILAQAYCGLVLKLPYRASQLDETILANNYTKFYNDGISIDLWPKIIKIYLEAKQCLNSYPNGRLTNKQISFLTPIISAVTFAKYQGKFGFGHGELIKFSIDKLNDLDFNNSYEILKEFMNEKKYTFSTLNNRSNLDKFISYFADKENLSSASAFIQKKDPFLLNNIKPKVFKKIKKEYDKIPETYPGMNNEIAKRLKVNPKLVYDAIEVIRNEEKR